MKLPCYILEIMNTLNTAGYEAFVVGGCLRDTLLGIEPKDYDITTNARPSVIQSLFDHTLPTGIQHGTVTVLSQRPVEVTTYRMESEYTDHRHPDKVRFVSRIEEDLSRRDFTINAMAYHPQIGLTDPFGGQDDLKKGIIRCVGNPVDRFCEDALRMLRAHRFAARFHFIVEKETADAIDRCQSYIKYVAVERIRQELIQILELDPYEIEHMTVLLSPWIPELELCGMCPQQNPYHDTNVLHHILRAVALLKPFDETLAYTLLFHDLAKPDCRTIKNGIDHFKGHPVKGAEVAERICKDLKLTSKQRKIIPALVRYHDSKMNDPLAFIYRFRIELSWSHEWFSQLLEVKRCDILAHSTYGQKTIKKWNRVIDVYKECLNLRPMQISDLAIDGNDVIRHTNYRGKNIHVVLTRSLQMCFDHPEMNNKKALIAYIRRHPWS